MKKICLKIDGMTCSACSNGLEKYLNRQCGINDAIVNLVLGSATIYYEESITIKQIETYIKEAGFKSLGDITNFDDKKNTNKERNDMNPVSWT